MLEVEIRVMGHVNRDWSNMFGDLAITHKMDGSTTLSGSVRDQSELRGVLSALADLGLDLISVNTKTKSNANILHEGGD
ncbi:MAG TPA: hypothetical protein G4O15_12485 [Dehalococcoidia bacterium]|nr:hypothetical protein [Dehalococcoidia bacterium]